MVALVLAAALASLLAACSSFTAALEADLVSGSAPLHVVFTNGGSGAGSHAWDFGDGEEPHQSGTSSTASHTYSKAGTFTVVLNTADGDKVATSSMTVTVSPGPLAQINLDSWFGDVAAGDTATVGATATDEFGNEIEGVSLSFEVPSGAGTVDGAGNFVAATTAGEFSDGLKVVAVIGDTTITTTADVNVVPAALDRVEVEPTELELTPTDSVQIVVRALDAHSNEITDAEVEINSDSGVGTVTQDGRFTASRFAGESSEGLTVVVIDDGQTVEVALPVSVVPGPLASVEITPGSYEAEVASTQAFTAVALDEFGNEVDGALITWSSHSSVGLVGSNGNFTAGTTAGEYAAGITATASDDGAQAESSVDVTLMAGPFTQVKVISNTVTAGETASLIVAAADEYGNAVDGAALEWSLVDSSVGRLSETGVLTPSSRAKTYTASVSVHATLGDDTESATFDVIVAPGPMTQLGVLPGNTNLGIGMSQRYVAVAGDRFGNPIHGANITWEADSAAGAISQSGLFVAGETPGRYTGAVTVTASFGGNEVSKTSTVEIEADRIIYYSDIEDELGQFVLIEPDGTDSKSLEIGAYAINAPTYSPDGRRIAYDFYTVEGGILVSDQEGNFLTLVVENSDEIGYHSPSWSPDGKRLAVIRQNFPGNYGDIVLVDIDGGALTVLIQNVNAYHFQPSWSPDGQFIVYDETPVGGTGDVWRVNVNTKQAVRLTTHSAEDSAPAYSPDGSKILFSSNRLGNYDLYVMDNNGNNLVNLTNSSDDDLLGSWNADGSKIAFTSYRDGDAEIYVMDVDGTNVTNVTNNTGYDSDPVWLPRKSGFTVTASAVILSSEAGEIQTVQALTAKLRVSAVRITTDLGSGSGFVIHTDGLILTNNHVVSDASQIDVTTDDGTQHSATVVGRDLTHDLAVLRIDATGLIPLEFGALTSSDLGSEVLVLGYPLGSADLNVTRGVVSAVKSDSGRNINWVQTDAAINHGNSGGPMLNLKGQVVGIVSAALFGESVENVGLAIGSTTILTYLDRLIAGETVIIN